MLEKLSRFYRSKKTFTFAIIMTMILQPIGMIMGLLINDLIPFEIIAYVILFLLLIGLFITHHKEDYILMNGIISGILVYVFVRYVYVFSFFADDVAIAYCRENGFLACFAFSFIYISVAVVFLIVYSHFTINRSRKINRTKIVLSQFLLFLSFFVPIVYIVLIPLFGYTTYQVIDYAIIYFGDAFLLLTVACCELELAMNRKDETVLEELNPIDVKATLWYASSFIFSLLCLVVTVLLSGNKTFVYALSVIDFILSLVLLIYYLNRKKKPSTKLRICLYVGFIMTIVIMAFFIGYFVWAILF